MLLEIFQVDAFSTKPFKGNPAAVCLLPAGALPLADEVRQSIAAEMNLAETAFVEPLSGQGQGSFVTEDTFRLRWFTPTIEVPLCGHATLAAAKVLFDEKRNSSRVLHFHTLSGVLSVEQEPGEVPHNGRMKMSLPLADPLDVVPDCARKGSQLVNLSTGGQHVHEVLFTAQDDLRYLLVVLEDSAGEAGLRSIQINASALLDTCTAEDVRGVIVTAAGGSDGSANVLSRFFAPWCGIAEDHVTGSAHSVLGPYWARRLQRDSLSALQCSGRDGHLVMDVDWEGKRVVLSAHAVVVLRGVLEL